jgi:NAD-dependent dihydropyrimidine dehydrogenase PreA subunit
MAAIWLDVTRCTGCGACIEVCPTGALTLVEGKAHLDDALCRGCEVCIQACPAGALQAVLEIEAVPLAPRVPEYAPLSSPVASSGRPGCTAGTASRGAFVAAPARYAVRIGAHVDLNRPRARRRTTNPPPSARQAVNTIEVCNRD